LKGTNHNKVAKYLLHISSMQQTKTVLCTMFKVS